MRLKKFSLWVLRPHGTMAVGCLLRKGGRAGKVDELYQPVKMMRLEAKSSWCDGGGMLTESRKFSRKQFRKGIGTENLKCKFFILLIISIIHANPFLLERNRRGLLSTTIMLYRQLPPFSNKKLTLLSLSNR